MQMHPEQDEAVNLLEEDKGEHDEFDDRREKGTSVESRTFRWLRLFGWIFTGCFLVTILSISSLKFLDHRQAYSSQANGHVTQDDIGKDMLGIRLHPEAHQSRLPTTITYHWNITSGYRSPDGVRKLVYLINDNFPGPTIECRSGDRLVIHVTNSLKSEGASIHWHGLEMRGANEMDGAVGFTQCPIPPSSSFTYDFTVGEDQAGTFWWHAHSQVQRGDGMFGGLVVHKPIHMEDEKKKYDYEGDVLVMVGDWYHRSADEVLSWYTSTRGFGNEPVPDSLLVNGAGKFICSMAVPARPVECVDIEDKDMAGILGTTKLEKSVRFRLVNVGSLAGFSVQMSSAKLRAVIVDGGYPIVADSADSVGIIYPGERVDLIVDWSADAASHGPHLHISLDPENFKYPNRALRPNQTFPILTSPSPSSLAKLDEPSHFDLSTAIGTDILPSSNAHQLFLLYTKTQKLSIDSNHPTGFMNRTSWSPQASPAFPLLSLPRSKWDDNQLIPHIPTSNSDNWVDIVINNLDDGSHPFHLHGYSFYVLASSRSNHGWGSYSPYATTGASAMKPKLNLLNPVKKDTVSIPRRGYVVIRFNANNEGIWMFHCHILFHQASGMAMGFQVGGDESHDVFDAKGKSLCPESSLGI